KCKKGCCSPATAPSPDSPKPDRGAPGKPKCPANCLNPLCSPAPAIEPGSGEGLVTDLGPAEHLAPPPQTRLSDAVRNRLDRPPRD
ncbi:MAG TPA: hypothetical protein VM529_14735, partial [Gemmata sp.]|nr:hypothetical protein [Gemmata sp.]